MAAANKVGQLSSGAGTSKQHAPKPTADYEYREREPEGHPDGGLIHKHLGSSVLKSYRTSQKVPQRSTEKPPLSGAVSYVMTLDFRGKSCRLLHSQTMHKQRSTFRVFLAIPCSYFVLLHPECRLVGSAANQ